MSDEPRLSPNLVMLVSIVAVSTASIFVRWSEAPAVIIAMYRMLISVVLLLPFFIRNDGFAKLKSLGVRDILGLIGVGVVLAIHFASWITSLGMTSVASSVIFVHSDPIFVAVVSHFFLKEKINGRVLTGIIISLVGVTIIAMGDAVVSETSLRGDLLALLGGLMLGIYLLGGRIFRRDLDLTTYVIPVYTSAAAVLILLSLLTGAPLMGYASREYLLFFLIALVPMIFGHTLYNWALRYVSAPVVSVSLLGEPVGASILAFVVLNETPGGQVLFGGVVTLAGILLSSYRSE